ncbi:beta-mannosidase [Klebsormidium nitens]|uniref:Beta-mannosidase B n=1 Tax=Klebsormidium nitens TaxID=105231 RepID=A0A1Y1IE07_KLENI|nr:beta-mannosidase [Klebsormidium nitens]|eukprot:GAQ87341.1 beta-mannosidase [Klebsormidium nitens]
MATALEMDLGGTAWTFHCTSPVASFNVQLPSSIPAVVPGCVHLDLQNAGLIKDVKWRDNETTLYWVAECDWEYRREFDVDAGLLACDKVILSCKGLDTLATVLVNGRPVISADNMFRTWTADVKHLLNPEEGGSSKNNRIQVTFRSTVPFMAEKQKEKALIASNANREEYRGAGWIRKEPASYGWDWGCAAPTFGIWRPIKLHGFKTAWLESIHITHPEITEVAVRMDPDTGTTTYSPPASVPICIEVELGSLCEKALDDTKLAVQIERLMRDGSGVKVLADEFELDAVLPKSLRANTSQQSTESYGAVDDVSSLAGEGNKGASEEASASGPYKGEALEQMTPKHVKKSNGRLEVDLEKPELWWPNGTGLGQTLYRVTVSLVSKATSEILSRCQKRVGLRTLKLVREKDEWGESFGFEINGVKIFAKGANWIPADIYLPRLTPEKYRALLQSAADVGMNMIRAWGGGLYEHPEFYDACDELGILVWQEFVYACSTYPVHDRAWLANCEEEAIEAVRALRHHACLALWCGNNELEQGYVGDTWTATTMPWDQYKHLFDVLLKDVVEKHDGRTSYWPSSPHTPLGGDKGRQDANDPRSGDAHCWDVWHGGKPFEVQRSWRHRFVSEFGFQSFPEPRTVAEYTLPEDHNVSSYVMDFRQRSVGRGNRAIFENLLEWFQMPRDFAECLWMSQLTQALCIQFAAEHLRRQQPQTEGVLYWQLNDEWPAPTWSSLDYRGRWKALHYFARRFFSRVLITGLEDVAKGTVEVHLSNHELIPVSGEVTWRLTDAAGTELKSGSETVTDAPSQANACVTTLDFSAALAKYGPRDLLVWLEWRDRREQARELWRHVADVGESYASRNLVLFARPKHLKLLKDPKITVKVESAASDGSLLLTLNSEHPALWVRLEIDDTKLPPLVTDRDDRPKLPGTPDRGAKIEAAATEEREKDEDIVLFEDNFFHLDGREPVTTLYRGRLTREVVTRALKATAVNMTWDP